MQLWQIIILSIIQGLTEFLPISSTAHLLIAQKLLNIEPNVFITVFLQLGTIIAAVIYFRKDIIEIFKDTVSAIFPNKEQVTSNKQLIFKDRGIQIFIGVIPTLVIAFILKDSIDTLYSFPAIIAASSVFFGLVFYLVEKWLVNQKRLKLENMSLLNYMLIGLAQAIAIIPGVSRSGATITGGMLQKVSLEDSIKTSFLMSIPVMTLAGVYELLKTIKDIPSDFLLNSLIGLVVAFIFGWISIKITLGFLAKRGFMPFLLYRIIFAVLILLVLV